MSSRYGRNQRRAARERIAHLERQLMDETLLRQYAQTARDIAQSEARSATDRAVRGVLQQRGAIEAAQQQIARELGRAMGPHFAAHVYRLMDADVRRKHAPITFDALPSDPFDQMGFTVIEGRVEPLTYRVRLSSW